MGRKDVENNASFKEYNTSEDISIGKKRKGRYGLFALMAILLLCVLAVTLYQGCGNDVAKEMIKPEPRPEPLPDSDTVKNIVVLVPDSTPVTPPRPVPQPPEIEKGETYFTIAKTRVADGATEAKVLGSIPYGSRILRLENDSHDFAKVKYGKIKGFVDVGNILNEEDFALFEGMFADRESLDAIPQTSLRRALFDYYKKQGMAQKWQAVPSGLQVGRIFDGNGTNSDMAIVFEEIKSGNRRILIFNTTEQGAVKLILDDRAYPAPYNLSDVAAGRYKLKIKYSRDDVDTIAKASERVRTVVYDEFHGRYMRR